MVKPLPEDQECVIGGKIIPKDERATNYCGDEIVRFGDVLYLKVREFLLSVPRKDMPMDIEEFFQRLIEYLSVEPQRVSNSWNCWAPNTIEKLVVIMGNSEYWRHFYRGLQRNSDAIDMDFQRSTIHSCFK